MDRHSLGTGREPEIEEPYRVLGIADEAAPDRLALDVVIRPEAQDDGDEPARYVLGAVENLVIGDRVPPDLRRLDLALLHHLE